MYIFEQIYAKNIQFLILTSIIPLLIPKEPFKIPELILRNTHICIINKMIKKNYESNRIQKHPSYRK